MACGVAGGLDHPDRPVAEGEFVTVAHRAVYARNRRRLVAWADDLAAVFLLQREIGLDMIAMVMGCEDMGDRPPALLRRLDDGIEFRRVDRRRLPGLRAMEKYAEVVTSADEDLNLQ